MWLIYAIFAAIVWGLDYSLSEEIFKRQISPPVLLVLQFFAGSLIFVPVIFFTHLKSELSAIFSNKLTFWLIISALFSFNVGNLLIFLSIQAKNATLAGLIELSYPLFTVIFSWLIFNINHFSWGTAVGGLLIFIGVIIIFYFGQ